MKELTEAANMAVRSELTDSTTSTWVKWCHGGVPDSPDIFRQLVRVALSLFRCCFVCTSLSGCYFNRMKAPEYPFHKYCHCKEENASPKRVTAKCDVEKFSGYIFSEKYKEKGKLALYTQLGFGIEDSEYLQQEYEWQAKKKYISGDYELGVLNFRGQRISIEIEFDRKGRHIKFKSGWMVRPNGYITCNTPLGG